MQSEPLCWPMKSHSEACERSIGFGLQEGVWRTRLAESLPAPALTRRDRASQRSISRFPAALSASFTVFEPER